jgi:HPt (histidine-containing phosphotransfer) domain-containing protein
VSERKSIDASLAILDPVPMEEAFGEIDEMAIETYELFISSTEPLLTELARQLAAGDTAGGVETAHSAKGAARMTGAFRLAGVCGHIERECKDGNGAEALEWLAFVPQAFDEVKRAIGNVRASHGL